MDLIKNDIIECPIDNLGINGEGIAHIEGKTVFIRGALPGEKTRAKIVFDRPGFCDARLLEVLTPSPDRITPDCPVFGKCGGCSLRHMTYKAELVYKRERLKETFRKIASIEIEPAPTVSSGSRIRCRNKLSMPVRSVKGQTVVGFFAAGSHRVVEVSDCLLQPKWNAPLISFVRRFLQENGLKGYDEETGVGDVRHVVAREIGGQLYVVLVVTDLAKVVYQKLPATLQFALGKKIAVYLNENRKQTNAILGSKTVRLSALPPVEIGGIVMDVHPAGFFQVNDKIREKLYARVVAECGNGTVVDAYAGAGLLTAMLAKQCKKAIGIELDRAAALSAARTVKLNDLSNMETIEGDCAALLPRFVTETAVVVLDPPRAGCSEQALEAASKANKIVYISCNPATLARDVKFLLAKGFTLEKTGAYDMFPGTVAMETLTVLTRAPGGQG